MGTRSESLTVEKQSVKSEQMKKSREAMKLEKEDEKYLRDCVEKRGGLCYKFVSPGNKGVPDRIVITPSGRVCFVEMKSSSGTSSKLQLWQIAELKRRNCDARILQGRDQIDSLLEEIFQDGEEVIR